MNKKEVADRLGCSTRQVEKYVGAKRLRVVKYIHGKYGRESVYDRAEVDRLEAELEAERQKVISDKPQTALTTRPAQAQTLALVEHITAGLDRQHADAERIIAALVSLKATNGSAPAVALTDRLTLSVADAAQLCGLSKGALRAAIHAGKLTARTVAGRRGFTIKRADLDAYVRGL